MEYIKSIKTNDAKFENFEGFLNKVKNNI